ncbi:MAG: protein kinase [Candidatus Heimdallarchaeota archaeon]|nr:protein kinase [Candidatus Heimdallarchaeota archaeon]MDH5647731.1 protein kinase [Candidatus Heimdallarchaeota archaeon]
MGKVDATIISTLGQGAQGTVHEVLIEHKKYALKIYDKTQSHSYSAQRRSRKIGEIISNPQVGALKRTWMLDNGEEDNGNPVMLHRLFKNPAIEDYYTSYIPPKSLRVREKIAIGLTAGIVEIHRNNIVHADLAPINVLYTQNGEVAIIDFDGAGYYPPDKTINSLEPIVKGHVQFPNWVVPPEIKKDVSGFGTDIWWLASIIMKVLTGYSPFFFLKIADDKSMRELLELIPDTNFSWPPNYEDIRNHSKIQTTLSKSVLERVRKVLNTTIATATLGEVFINYTNINHRPNSIKIWSSFRSRCFK